MKALCIYHGNCQDGFAAAWAVRKALGEENVEFYPGVYQNDPPDVTNRHVLLVDFSYKRPVLNEMAAKATSILILDHHKSAEEDLLGIKAPPWTEGLAAIFNQEKSGAGITWDYFFGEDTRPGLVDHIEDRDLWRFALPQTREIAAALFSYPYEFDLWDKLMDESKLPELIIEGRAIERKHHQDINNLLPVVQRSMKIGGIIMPVACMPLTLTSDAGHRMAKENNGVSACYWDTYEGRVFSLRSTDNGPDVSEIAKIYGGGGHKHAAGFRVELNWEGE